MQPRAARFFSPLSTEEHELHLSGIVPGLVYHGLDQTVYGACRVSLNLRGAMDAELIQAETGRYVHLTCNHMSLSNEDDVLAVLAVCGEHQVQDVLIDQSCLAPDFCDLKSGVAGLILHKLSSYKMRAAFVGGWDQVRNERFQEFLRECNRGRQFHFSSSLKEAEQWLLADGGG